MAGLGGTGPLTVSPTDDMSAYRGVAARRWETADGRKLDLAVAHFDEWAPVRIARELARLSPESFGALILARAS